MQPQQSVTTIVRLAKGEAPSKEEALVAIFVSCVAAGIFLWAIAGFPF